MSGTSSSDRIRVEVKYSLGHTLRSTYVFEKSLHCPNCGALSVWCDSSEGDYYVGPTYVCTECRHTWTMQGPSPERYTDAQVIDQIIGEGGE